VSGAPRPLGEVGGRPEGAVSGCVMGTLVHGLFENHALLAALAGGEAPDASDPYDALADHFGAALRMDLIDRLAGVA
jgi:cobyric acid synthase